jgi:GNAT superfamily N-acetyltransferase
MAINRPEPPRSLIVSSGQCAAYHTRATRTILDGSAVMAEILRRLRATDAVLLWASARDKALPFYERFGFQPIDGSGFTGQTGRPTTSSSSS